MKSNHTGRRQHENWLRENDPLAYAKLLRERERRANDYAHDIDPAWTALGNGGYHRKKHTA